MITEEQKKDFDNCVKYQINELKDNNEVYYENVELFKVLIDINLECIENLEMLIK